MLKMVGVAAAAVTVPVITATPASASVYMGNIGQQEVVNRAENWYQRNIQYSNTGTASDPDGNHNYRRDCSGFVSMCWHSSAPGHSTATLADICDHIGGWDNLRRGDAILKPKTSTETGHVVLFTSWVEGSNKTRFHFYDMANTSLDMRHTTGYISSYRADYYPMRYKKLVLS